jgi:aminoglycoside phosphotransferase (APT) family kinase protein
MSTIGHPLSDLSNLLSPYTFGATAETRATFPGANNLEAFAPDSTFDGIPRRDQCIEWYTEIAGWNPGPDINWGSAFGVFRNSVIMQGIAARVALRQASSAKAKDHADKVVPFGNYLWQLVQEVELERKSRKESKL